MSKKHLHIFLPLVIIYVLILIKPNLLGMYLSPIVLLLAAGYLAIRLLKTEQTSNAQTNSSSVKYAAWGLYSVGSVAAILFAQSIYFQNPIDIAKSDIIPLLKEIYYTRYIGGTFVYAHVSGYDYVSWTPNYLPMHWLPFVPAFYFNVDPRWMSLGALLATIGLYVYVLLRQKDSMQTTLVKTLLPFLFIITVFVKQTATVAHNIEFLIAAFYMLLALGLQTASRFATTTGFTFTLLSRYMAVFYLPVDFFISVIQKDKKQFINYALVVLAILVIYVVPFLSKDFTIFFNGASAYDIAALGEWNGQSWQPVGDMPFQLFQGYGFASWCYKMGAAPLETKIAFYKITLVVVMTLLAIITCYIYNKWQHHISTTQFKTSALFMVLLTFASFSLVPYNYLFLNALFVIPVLLIPYTFVNES